MNDEIYKATTHRAEIKANIRNNLGIMQFVDKLLDHLLTLELRIEKLENELRNNK
jgi:hypothetical protein